MFFYSKNGVGVKFNQEMPELEAMGYKRITEGYYNYLNA